MEDLPNYTIKERLAIYEKALDIYNPKDKYTGIPIGLCAALDYAIRDIHQCLLDFDEILDILPEFQEIKPLNTLKAYWWDMRDRTVRIKALKTMINNTKNKL